MKGLMPFSLAVQAASFASSIALARVFGATSATDAYFVGLSVPVLVYAILLTAVRSGATPSLTSIAAAEDPRSFTAAANGLLSATSAAAFALAAATTVVAALVVPPLLGGTDALASQARLTIIELMPLGVTGAMTGALGAVLAVRGVFAPQIAVMALEPILKTVLTVALGHAIGIQALIVGNVAGSALAAAALFAVVRRDGVPIRFVRAVDTSFVRGVFALSSPLLISQSVLQVNPLVDRTMASGLGAGSVTSLELGLRLFVVPTALLTATLVGPVTATWARRMELDGWPALRESITGMLNAGAWILPPAMVLGVVLRKPLVDAVYSGGAYSTQALHATTSVVAMLILSLPAQMLTVGFSTLFLVHRQTIFPMKVGMANAALNIALNFVLRPFFGVAGIALSTSLTLTILLVAYAVEARRRWGSFYTGGLDRLVFVVVTSILISSGAALAAVSVLPAASTRPRALLTLVVVAAVVCVVHAAAMTVGKRHAPSAPSAGASA